MKTSIENAETGFESAAAMAVAGAALFLSLAAAATGWAGIPADAPIPPVAALAAMWLIAALLQSNTAAALVVVAASAAGWLTPPVAVWGIVGCNLGATASATATGLGHFRRDAVFRRSLAGSTADVLVVFAAAATVLVVESATGWMSALVTSANSSMRTGSPLELLRGLTLPYFGFLRDGLALSSAAAGLIMVAAGSAISFLTLDALRRRLFAVSGAERERLLHRLLGSRSGIGAGMAVGACTQSSAMTHASLIPLSASGLLDLQAAVVISRASAVGALILPVTASIILGVPGVGAAHVALILVGLALSAIPSARAAAASCARRIAGLSAGRPALGLAMMTCVVLVLPLLLLGIS